MSYRRVLEDWKDLNQTPREFFFLLWFDLNVII